MKTKPTISQMELFFKLIEDGLITKENLQEFLNNCIWPDVPIENGLVIVESVETSTFDVSNLKPIKILEPGEMNIDGVTMRARAFEKKANFGLFDAKRLIDNQDQIPEEVKFHCSYIILPGTILKSKKGELYVPYFFQWSDGWRVQFRMLKEIWDKRFWLIKEDNK